MRIGVCCAHRPQRHPLAGLEARINKKRYLRAHTRCDLPTVRACAAMEPACSWDRCGSCTDGVEGLTRVRVGVARSVRKTASMMSTMSNADSASK
eukprot:2651307-Rhodomonas_salina.1